MLSTRVRMESVTVLKILSKREKTARERDREKMQITPERPEVCAGQLRLANEEILVFVAVFVW